MPKSPKNRKHTQKRDSFAKVSQTLNDDAGAGEDLHEGVRVRIVGLPWLASLGTEFKKSRGTLEQWIADKERWEVRLDTMGTEDAPLVLKPENLVNLEWVPPVVETPHLDDPNEEDDSYEDTKEQLVEASIRIEGQVRPPSLDLSHSKESRLKGERESALSAASTPSVFSQGSSAWTCCSDLSESDTSSRGNPSFFLEELAESESDEASVDGMDVDAGSAVSVQKLTQCDIDSDAGKYASRSSCVHDLDSVPVLWCSVPEGSVEAWVAIALPAESAPPGAFDGLWVNNAEEKILIQRLEVMFESGVTWHMDMHSLDSISVFAAHGRRMCAEVVRDKFAKKLLWSDGDVWSFFGEA